MLDLRRLTTFREVVQRRSFSGAAQALDYTQSSVSQQIATLEREIGAPLIDRGGRPPRPTAVGEVLFARAQGLLDHAASVERDVGALTRGESGTLRVGGFFTAWATFMPVAVAAFSAAHPGVQLELQQREPEPALRGVRVGDLDVAVLYRFARGRDDDARLAWTHLLDDPYAIALPAGHRLARRRHVALSELASERWVSPGAGDPYTRMLIELCGEHGGFEPNVAYETADIAMAQPLVAAGFAVALLPALGLVPRHAGVVVRSLRATPPARSVWAVSRADAAAPTAATMTAALVEAAGEV